MLVTFIQGLYYPFLLIGSILNTIIYIMCQLWVYLVGDDEHLLHKESKLDWIVIDIVPR